MEEKTEILFYGWRQLEDKEVATFFCEAISVTVNFCEVEETINRLEAEHIKLSKMIGTCIESSVRIKRLGKDRVGKPENDYQI